MAHNSLDEILITNELVRRSARKPNLEREIAALHGLAETFAINVEAMLQTLVDAAIVLCEADAAGISLEKKDAQGDNIFLWIATSGTFAPYLNGTTPRNFSPCGITVDQDAPQLFRLPERVFTYLANPRPIEEALLLPWRTEPETVGTLWIVSHRTDRHFDLEDARLMRSIVAFVSVTVRRSLLDQRSQDTTIRADLANELAHQINNPLQSCLSALFLLREQHDQPGAVVELARMAENEMMRVSKLVKQILTKT